MGLKDNMFKKFGLMMIPMAILGLVANAFLVWTGVEFLLYLVKDIPFNWASLYWTIGTYILFLGSVVVSFIIMMLSD